ncbi:sugar ABC transporter substrate-binding protein [Sphaerisporangium melleum]|uniref:Sugar ABC transporter substrate-binding protein n=1 Tax=Sphaerisporangium melleum TaxID=321316 RepID=A0A917R573_9ACTN|nr:extracellular solute-binding protein [Sphaerisporangium melleum]GGK89884.1 sugar ABC transporter substrate-binding protein [Sphaerisporangium melleum]GII72552.1 sugar ABC transporter substrate-binding protein [Sphaerisporangium melleum]
MGTRRLSAVAAVALAAALAAGCSGGTAGETASPAASAGAPARPVKLTYWTWVPNMDKIVQSWNAAHPDIQVTVSKQAGGDDAAAKFLTAAKAGNPPDLVQAEYQMLPSFVAADAVADIKAEAGPAKAEFGEGVWSLVTLGTDAVYAIPQDSGPMMFYYRRDLFDKYGLKVPTTWDEYAATARALHEKNPKVLLGAFSSKDPGSFAGLAQQAGARWWSIDGEAWKVAIADEPTLRVAGYWGGLVKEGVIGDKPYFTPEWNKALNDGTQLSWISAVWAPGVLASNAPDGKGKWAVAPLPQWNASEPHTGFWGGSSTAVAATSPSRQAAVRFATWLNTDPQAVALLAGQGAVYPASVKGQAALSKDPDYFADRPGFWKTAAEIGATARGFTFGPNVNVTYNAFKDAFGKAIQDRSDFAAAVRAMQDATVADMRKSGFQIVP